MIDTYQEMNSHYLHAIFRKNDGAGASSVAHWRQVAKEAALLVSPRGIVDMYKKKESGEATRLKVFYQTVGFISTRGTMLARVQANSKTGRFKPQRSEVKF